MGGVGSVLSYFGKGGRWGFYAGLICGGWTEGVEGRVWRCAVIVAFFFNVWCISGVRNAVGLAGVFDRELCVGGVVDVGNVDIKEKKGRCFWRSCIGDSGVYCTGDRLVGIEACPHLFGWKGSKIENIVERLLSILRELHNNGPCCYPIPVSDFWGVWQQGMNNPIFVIKRLLGGEVTRNRGVNLDHHRPCGRVYSRGIGGNVCRRQGAIHSCSSVFRAVTYRSSVNWYFIRVRKVFIFYNC